MKSPKKPAKAKSPARAASPGWETPRVTGLLVLADGTVIEAAGLGAEGEAVGEICFNTAMTGYQEVLTDPSYAGQIVTFTFPHIGNVGTNDADIETTNLAASAAAVGCIIRTPVTEPANYRSTRPFDKWLKARGLIGLSGIDTRALTNLIRDRGMPNGVIAHSAKGKFDIAKLKKRAAEWPGLVGMDLARDVSLTQRLEWDEKLWDWKDGYTRAEGGTYRVVAVDYGLKRNILRCLTSAGCDVTVVPASASADGILAMNPDGIFLSNGPGDPAATGVYAVPEIRKLVELGKARLRHMSWPPDARHRPWRQHRENASRPPRRKSSGEGLHHRQGRNHLDEPWFRGGSRQPAGRCCRNPCLALRRLKLRYCT